MNFIFSYLKYIKKDMYPLLKLSIKKIYCMIAGEDLLNV